MYDHAIMVAYFNDADHLELSDAVSKQDLNPPDALRHLVGQLDGTWPLSDVRIEELEEQRLVIAHTASVDGARTAWVYTGAIDQLLAVTGWFIDSTGKASPAVRKQYGSNWGKVAFQPLLRAAQRPMHGGIPEGQTTAEWLAERRTNSRAQVGAVT